MAIYHLSVKPVQRSKGRSSTASAAYRAAEKIRDKRTGQIYDFTRKQGVLHREVITPYGVNQTDRQSLWNMAEAAEKRRDGTTAREYEIALPSELSAQERIDLAREFAGLLVQRYGVAVDLCLHAPSHGDERNYHAHLLATTRIFEDGQLTRKSDVDLSDRDRTKKGLCTRREELYSLREAWGRMANRALERAGQEERIDHRSLQDQGVRRVATVHRGPHVSALERRGIQTRVGDLDREAREVNAEIVAMEHERRALNEGLSLRTSFQEAQQGAVNMWNRMRGERERRQEAERQAALAAERVRAEAERRRAAEQERQERERAKKRQRERDSGWER